MHQRDLDRYVISLSASWASDNTDAHGWWRHRETEVLAPWTPSLVLPALVAEACISAHGSERGRYVVTWLGCQT